MVRDEACEFWLWPEGERVRWWWRDGSLRLQSQPPLAVGEQSGIRRLGEWVPEEVMAHLGRQLAAGVAVRIRLEAALPDEWHRLPCESLNDSRGEPLYGRLLAERYLPTLPCTPPLAGWGAIGSEAVLPDTLETVLCHLLPQGSPEEAPFERARRSEKLDRVLIRQAGLNDLGSEDPGRWGLMGVVCHGEGPGGEPFRLWDGSGWRFPTTGGGVPRLMVLLACNPEGWAAEGSWLGQAQDLLKGGAEAVLVAVGRLEPQAAAHFWEFLLRQWWKGEPLWRILMEAHGAPGQDFGARRFRLLGNGDLRRGDPEGVRSGLARIAERITLVGWRHQVRADRVPQEEVAQFAQKELRKAMGLTGDWDQPEAREVPAQLQPIAEESGLLTRHWLLGLLAYTAELHDHRRIACCQHLWQEFQRQNPPEAPLIWYQTSKLLHRQGRYPKEALYLAQGCAALPESGMGACGLSGQKLLGGLWNLLVDIHMPELGRTVGEAWERCESSTAEGTSDDLEMNFKKLDREARLALRDGDLETARCRYEEKLRRANGMGKNGLRELGWLLYVGSWAGKVAPGWIIDILDHLGQWTPHRDEAPRGNDDLSYLLRALALRVWRGPDHHLAEALRPWWAVLDGWRTQVADPGPLGMATAFLRLYQREHPGRGAAMGADLLPSWQGVRGRLKDEHYYLELAVLERWLGSRPEADRCWRFFHNQRQEVLGSLRKLSWPFPGRSPDWEGAWKKQEGRDVAAWEASEDGEALVLRFRDAGLLPQ